MTSKMVVRPLHADEFEDFRKLTTHHIGLWYDDIDESFAQIIIDAHKLGFDPLGYFTKAKTIWAADQDGKMCGFLVGTEKRGGSVKLAPGIMKPELQRKGLGTQLWRAVEAIYAGRNARKIYNHAPFCRWELLKWVTSLGLCVEAHLLGHYRREQDEYVAGKLLRTASVTLHRPRSWTGRRFGSEIREYRDGDQAQLQSLILGMMPEWYDEIDASFVESIIQGSRRFDKRFREKGKKVWLVFRAGELVGCCVATPKRGGSVKLVPFLLRPEVASLDLALELLQSVEADLVDLGYHKVYASVPAVDLDTSSAFRMAGFQVEGYLREPYKAGVDNVFFGKRLVL